MKGKLLLKILKAYLDIKGNPEKIRSYIRSKKITKSHNLDCIDPKNICVAAIQEKVAIMKNYQQYVTAMYSFTREAVEKGAQLISFPEENGVLVLGMLPFAKIILNIIQLMSRRGKPKPSDNEKINDKIKDMDNNTGPAGGGINKVISFLTPFICNVFETTFSELASSFGIYIMAGSAVIEHNGELVNRAYLFGPDGEIVGTQDKAHLVELEMDMGLVAGERLKVFSTRIGKIAFPVCMDATYFETFKILKKQGAQIILIPIADMGNYNYYHALRGIWPRVQESGIYGVKSSLVGDLYGIRFTGKAGIFAPLELTSDKNGVIAEAVSFDSSEMICQSIDLTLIDKYSSPYFCDENPELYRKYFPGIYDMAENYTAG